MRSLGQTLILLVFFLLTAAFGSPARAEDDSLIPGILGKDDRTAVPGTEKSFDAVGHINVTSFSRRRRCTGTLIARDRVVTSAHCLVDRDGRPRPVGQIHFVAGVHLADYFGSFESEVRPTGAWLLQAREDLRPQFAQRHCSGRAPGRHRYCSDSAPGRWRRFRRKLAAACKLSARQPLRVAGSQRLPAAGPQKQAVADGLRHDARQFRRTRSGANPLGVKDRRCDGRIYPEEILRRRARFGLARIIAAPGLSLIGATDFRGRAPRRWGACRRGKEHQILSEFGFGKFLSTLTAQDRRNCNPVSVEVCDAYIRQ